MNTTAKLSHAESKAREAKKAMRGAVRRLSLHSKEGVVQTMVQGSGPPIGTAYYGIWHGMESAKDGLTNLRRLIGMFTDVHQRRLIVNAARSLRK